MQPRRSSSARRRRLATQPRPRPRCSCSVVLLRAHQPPERLSIPTASHEAARPPARPPALFTPVSEYWPSSLLLPTRRHGGVAAPVHTQSTTTIVFVWCANLDRTRRSRRFPSVPVPLRSTRPQPSALRSHSPPEVAPRSRPVLAPFSPAQATCMRLCECVVMAGSGICSVPIGSCRPIRLIWGTQRRSDGGTQHSPIRRPSSCNRIWWVFTACQQCLLGSNHLACILLRHRADVYGARSSSCIGGCACN